MFLKHYTDATSETIQVLAYDDFEVTVGENGRCLQSSFQEVVEKQDTDSEER